MRAVYSGGFRAPEKSSLPGVWSIRCGFVYVVSIVGVLCGFSII